MHFTAPLKSLVKASQVLYSERCINETTLDKMETLEDTLDEKTTTLLSAIQTAVSSDHKKLNVCTAVLSMFEETKLLSERLTSEYGEVNNCKTKLFIALLIMRNICQ